MQFHIVERVIPLEFALNSCFLISYNRNYRHERSVNMQDGNGISENIYAWNYESEHSLEKQVF